VSKEFPRHWVTTVDLYIIISDGFIIHRKKGTIWDGASVPKILWWLFKPTDKALLGDFIHDCLWEDKGEQLRRNNYNIYQTRLFADNERNTWREQLILKSEELNQPQIRIKLEKWFILKIKNPVTHKVIRLIGGLYYSRELVIPT
jgi:hypothetical protein